MDLHLKHESNGSKKETKENLCISIKVNLPAFLILEEAKEHDEAGRAVYPRDETSER